MKTFEKTLTIRGQELSGQSLKDYLVQSAIRHREMDEIVKGQYWSNGKGCAVGCTLHDLGQTSTCRHALYEDLLGVPEAIALLQDRIFENLPDAASKVFPERFWESVPVGADLSRVVDQFTAHVLREELFFDREQFPQVEECRKNVLDLYERRLRCDEPAEKEWSAAESAAWIAESAAESARSAAWVRMASALCDLMSNAELSKRLA